MKQPCRGRRPGGPSHLRRLVSPWLVALSITFAGPAAANRAAGPDGYRPGSFEDRVDLAVRDGFERPAEALLTLDQLRLGAAATPANTRLLL
jgi:hypothetical protein